MLDGEKSELENRHGVRISAAAFDLPVRAFQSSQLFPDGNQQNSVQILDEACKMVQENFRNCADEINFNDKAYKLGRTLVELTELYRDNNHRSLYDTRFWVDRLKSERDSASFQINDFLNRWADLEEPTIIFHDKDVEKIRSLRDHIIASPDLDNSSLPIVDQFLVDIQRVIIDHFQQKLTVYARHVAEVISRVTDVPLTQILPSIKDHKKNAIDKTNKRVVNQEHVVSEIFETLASERKIITRRPVGSFLLLGNSGVGKREIAKAVALHWYCDANRLVEIDMSQYADDDVMCCCSNFFFPLMRSKRSDKQQQHLWNRLTEAVAKRPYSVILLDKMDKASSTVITSVLLRILSDDNAQSDDVDFSKSIIFMTSSSNPLEFNETHDCTLKDNTKVLAEARKIMGGDLLLLLDKILVVERFHNHKAVARLLLREIVREAYGERCVVHASNAALDVLFLMAQKQCLGEGGNAIKKALIKHIISPLSATNDLSNNAVVCVDTLVGSSKLSFRVEPSHGPKSVADRYFNFKDGTFDEYFANMKMTVEAMNKIFHLRRQILEILDLSESGQDLSPLRNLLLEACDGLLVRSVSLSAYAEMLRETKNKKVQLLRQFSYLPKSALKKLVREACDEISSHYMPSHPPLRRVDKEIASNDQLPTDEETEKIKSVCRSLQRDNNETGIAKAAKATIDVLVEMSDSALELPHLPPRNYMFEGLNHKAKTKLIDYLSESLGDSFFTYIKLDENCKGGQKEKESLIEKVKDHPCMVVLIDGVEFADCVFYKCLLDIFDKGTLDDCEGFSVEFRRTIILLTSEMGNKCRIAAAFFKDQKIDVSIKALNQDVERKRFRTELLHRMDGIIFFDPVEPEEGDIRFLSTCGDMKNSDLLSPVLFQLFEAEI